MRTTNNEIYHLSKYIIHWIIQIVTVILSL